jgi:hypothetical protein
MVRTLVGFETDASYLTCFLPVVSPPLLSPSCGGGEEKLVHELEEATVRRNRGIMLLQCRK